MKKQIYYVSLDDKKISDEPFQGKATLKIIAEPEDVKKIKEYMYKSEDETIGGKYEADLKTLFQLMYNLGTEETRKSLNEMLK